MSEREIYFFTCWHKEARLRRSRTNCTSATLPLTHVQHILPRLDAHTRLEAIRRAEHAGLI